MYLDIEDYLKSLIHERFRSVILYHKDYPVLEEFFIESAKKTGGYHIDILNIFLYDQELTSSLDLFSVSKLKDLLVKLSKNHSVVYLTNLDFLLDTWDNIEKNNFITLIKRQWNGFYPENSATLVFGLHADNWLQSLDIFDTKGRPRVYKLNEFKANS